MSRRNPCTRFILGSALALIACSDQSPTAPDTAASDLAAARPQTVAGTYDISFEVTSSGLGILLIANVAHAGSLLPATDGEARFYVCKAGRNPAPSSECASGQRGRWDYIWSNPIISQGPYVGTARYGIGNYPTGTVAGFRFHYNGTRDGIADGWSDAEDYTF